jgi:hypothetical protein
MAFPITRLQLKTEIAPGADLTGNPNLWPWVDITSSVRADPGISRDDMARIMQERRHETPAT